jgi:hypothetical protein
MKAADGSSQKLVLARRTTNLSGLEIDRHRTGIGSTVKDGEGELLVGLVEFMPGKRWDNTRV